MNITPRQALKPAFRKVKPHRDEIEAFKSNLLYVLDHSNETESEEFHKNLLRDFLKKTYYDPDHFMNTKGRKDMVIHEGKSENTPVAVIIETKRPTNKSEMVTENDLNAKAMQELLLYYFDERIKHKNEHLKHLVITNIYEWFIFDAHVFDKYFYKNTKLLEDYQDFDLKRMSGSGTDYFYTSIAAPFIEEVKEDLEFTHFDLKTYTKILRKSDPLEDSKLIPLYKIFSPEHLLKLPFVNDSNSLDKRFYSELLHLIGLKEVKQGSKKLIERYPEGERNSASLLENAINKLNSRDTLSQIENLSTYGETREEQLFSVSLELCITWINRILFLKLLEAQLLSYHKGDPLYKFLNIERIKNYDDLDSLFFDVLACKYEERTGEAKTDFSKIPYLNSSLFEPSDLERKTIYMTDLRDERYLPLLNATVLKNKQGKKLKGDILALEYLFKFLDAYDFTSEGKEEIQEEKKSLINASVLGLIFEKINGYKDGSYFTPGFITEYMCRETIRRAVVQKFNEAKGWNCKDLTDIHNKDFDIAEANEIVNSLKICDPAVGSGHFLVSALNEILAIKHELKILCDREGKRLKTYRVEVVNDELIIRDREDGEFFEYHPGDNESRRVQEALFHEKQTIIENCLFGVDINPNSVKICRLRLWIELLKNAYYKNETELETLPNIDINIKCGNSLISRFDIKTDLSKALKKSKYDIDSYRDAVHVYQNAKDKEQKRKMQDLIDEIKGNFRIEIYNNDPKFLKLHKLRGEIFTLTNQQNLFEMSKKEKTAWEKKITLLTADSRKLDAEIDEIKNNKIYENAFEWRFEFPEVLDSKGDFIGFDVVIGNPPYVFGGSSIITNQEKAYYKNDYEVGKGKVNLFTLFIEKSYKLMKQKGEFSFIIPNTFLRVTSYDGARQFFLNNFSFWELFDAGNNIFSDAITTSIVLLATKLKPNTKDITLIKKDPLIPGHSLDLEYFIKNNYIINTNLTPEKISVLSKIKTDSTPLGDECKEMIFGVVITKNINDLVFKKHKKDLKPFLEGKDIGPYYIKPIYRYLNYQPNSIHRPRSPEIFEAKEKLLIQRITGGEKPLKVAYDNNGYYNKESINNIILKDTSKIHIKYLLGLLNSKLMSWFYSNQFTNESILTVNLSKEYLSQIPVKIGKNQNKIIKIADRILDIKNDNYSADVSKLKSEIDQLVYELYGLSEEEIGIVEGKK